MFLMFQAIETVQHAVDSFAGYGVVGSVAIGALYFLYVKDQALSKLQEQRRLDALEFQKQLKAESDARIKDTQEGSKMLLEFQKNAVDWVHNASTITDYLDDQRRGSGGAK